MQLTERMKMIAGLIKECDVLADVGCDHAYITIEAVKSGRAKKAYAMDVRKGPLERAAANIKAAGLDGRIETVLSDGLKGLGEKVSQVIVSGMGGMLICRILDEGKEKLKECERLILSPQSDRAEVRRKLHEMGFYICREADCHDSGKYYQCICAEHGEEKYEREIFYEYGKLLLEEKSEELIRHLKQKKAKTTAVEQSIRRADPDIAVLPSELIKEMDSIDDALKFIGKG